MTELPLDDDDTRPDSERDLIEIASVCRGASYVPYSGFSMGAAVRSDDGRVFHGALVENVSLGLAMCAERIALFTAVTAGARPVELALVAKRTSGHVTFPCGACLQVALELGGPDLVVHAGDLGGDVMSVALRELLPLGPRIVAGR